LGFTKYVQPNLPRFHFHGQPEPILPEPCRNARRPSKYTMGVFKLLISVTPIA
jgi:hypothetical protein